MKKPACVTFSTGFAVNLGVLATIAQKGDTIYLDRQDHACIYDGARLAIGADVKKFRHNDPADLRRLLALRRPAAGRFLVVDGVFSMEGDIAPIPEYVDLCDEWDMAFMVDDAHGIGVLGKHGRGTVEHFGLEDRVDLIMGTFSKSLATVGGFVVGDVDVIKYIKHRARSLIFTAAPPPASVAAALAAVDIIEAEPERRERLWENTRFMMTALRAMGFDCGESETPGHSRSSSARTWTPSRWPMRLQEEGVFVNAVVSPATPAGAGPDPDVVHGDAHEGAPHAAPSRRSGRSAASWGSFRSVAGVRVAPVSSRRDLGDFVELPFRLYRDDPNWAPPLRSDVRWMLDEAKNPFWKHARRRLFLARRDGRVVGRIAAIADDEHNRVHADRTAFFGFFECENDRGGGAAPSSRPRRRRLGSSSRAATGCAGR